MDVISLVYEFEEYTNSNKDWYTILIQGLDTAERRVKFLDRAKKETHKLIDEGKFLHKVSVYSHKMGNFTYKKAKLIEF